MSGASSVRRRKLSDYGVRLHEKQKARHCYGIGEKQFRKTFAKAVRQKGMSGDNFIKMLESRLDNFVYRVGLASSRQQSRQLVRHGHFMVNNRTANIPSLVLKANDTVQIKSRSVSLFKSMIDVLSKKKPGLWYSFDPAKNEAVMLRLPERTEIDIPVSEQMIVEFYSR
jgi:small subunit ribosomal protein S4